MQFCTKCGNELADDAKICMNCGCAVAVQKSDSAAKANKISSKKKIILIIIAAVLTVALSIGVYYLVSYIRVINVVNDLAGEVFTYYESTINRNVIKAMDFDNKGNLTYSYYYSNVMDTPSEYTRAYKIKFKGSMIFLEANLDEFEIQYNKYGKIVGIYDINYGELYD